MSARIGLQARIDDYLAERRRRGFHLRSRDTFLAGFARFVADRRHRGPLTVELMTDWVRQGKGGRGSPVTWARRLSRLRHFIRYLQQFEPDTEVPDESIFGPEPGRVAPHIYREEEVVELLANIVRPQLPNLDSAPLELLLQQQAHDTKSALARPRREAAYVAKVFVVAMQLFDDVIRQRCR